jgi:hypothetical protein
LKDAEIKRKGDFGELVKRRNLDMNTLGFAGLLIVLGSR